MPRLASHLKTQVRLTCARSIRRFFSNRTRGQMGGKPRRSGQNRKTACMRHVGSPAANKARNNSTIAQHLRIRTNNIFFCHHTAGGMSLSSDPIDRKIPIDEAHSHPCVMACGNHGKHRHLTGMQNAAGRFNRRLKQADIAPSCPRLASCCSPRLERDELDG